MSFQWYLTKERSELIEQVKKTPDGGRDLSKVIETALKEYLKAHGEGNPSFSLDKFNDPGFKAYPTAWTQIGKSQLQSYDLKEIETMVELLKTNLANLSREAQERRKQKLIATGLTPRN